MPKAATIISEMTNRYAELAEILRPLADNDPRADDLLDELGVLENRIMATPATSKRDFAAKKRFARKNARELDLDQLVNAILELDAERVEAA
jgi:hypothetical protein